MYIIAFIYRCLKNISEYETKIKIAKLFTEILCCYVGYKVIIFLENLMGTTPTISIVSSWCTFQVGVLDFTLVAILFPILYAFWQSNGKTSSRRFFLSASLNAAM